MYYTLMYNLCLCSHLSTSLGKVFTCQSSDGRIDDEDEQVRKPLKCVPAIDRYRYVYVHE